MCGLLFCSQASHWKMFWSKSKDYLKFQQSVCEIYRLRTKKLAAGTANTCVYGVTCRFLFWDDTVLILRVNIKDDQDSECDEIKYYLPDTARRFIFMSPES